MVYSWRDGKGRFDFMGRSPLTLATMLACLLIFIFCGCKKKPAQAPPPEVQTITVSTTNVAIFEEWIGALDGFVNAQIRAQVSGYLLKQNYQEGSEVKTGDVLFEIDPRPFQAALDQTLAKLAQDQAQEHKTELDVNRFTPLAKSQAISQEELDDAVQANLAAVAQLKSDQAQVENAQLNLGFTKILSPVDGLAGIALGQIGDLVSASSGLLTTVSTINPIKVYFNVSEQSYMDFWRNYTSSNTDQTNLELQLILSDGKPFPEKGKFYLADRQVNANTGTLQIAGLFPNPQLLLRPGQYGRVRAQTETRTNTILVPQRAVAELQGTYQVVIVQTQNNTNTTHLKSVKVGPQIGANWIIENGLAAGDRVVVEGTQQAKQGTIVNPKPWNPSAQTNSPPDAAGTNAPATASTNQPPK